MKTSAFLRFVLVPTITLILMVGVAITFLVLWNSPERQDSIIPEWNASITKLGIEPIYPPEEDIAVGDLYAVITSDQNLLSDSAPFLGRSVKLYHVDATAILENVYSAMYEFPNTVPKPVDTSEIWEQPQAKASIFKTGDVRSTLPLAIFPGVTVTHRSVVETGLMGSFHGFAEMMGLSGSNRKSVSVKIPLAETYGIPSLPATGLLVEFCSSELTKSFCLDKSVREQLEMLIGGQIFDKVQSGGKGFRYHIELDLVSRVFLTRSIESVLSTGSTAAVTGRVLADVSNRLAQASDEAANSPKSGDKSVLSDELLKSKKQIDDLLAKPGNSPSGGSSANVGLENGSEITLSETLQRPVVFGIRTVRMVPKEEEESK